MRGESRRGDALRIADIIGAAIRLEPMREKGYDRFSSDPDAIDLAVRRLEIIGEAAGHVSDDTTARYPEVPWKQMRGFASFAKHEYWKLKHPKVWKAIEAMPAVRRALSRARVDDAGVALRRDLPRKREASALSKHPTVGVHPAPSQHD